MNSLRQTYDHKEIIYFIKDSIQKATKIMLWQNIEGKRNIWFGRILFIDESAGKIIISTVNKDQDLSIDDKFTLYVKGDFESVLFKAEIKQKTKNSVELSFPEFAYLYEKRQFERFKFHPEANNISFGKSMECFKHSKFSGNLLDISRQGLTLIVPPNFAQNWSPEDTINIFKISDNKLTEPLAAQVVYIKPIRNFKNNRMYLKYRFGLKFKEEMNRLQINKLKPKKQNKAA